MLSYNDVLIQLQDYMLDEENIKKSLMMKMTLHKNDKDYKNDKKEILQIKKENLKVEPVLEPVLEPVIKKTELFIPNQQDSLFWCFYIIKNGQYNYQILNNKNALMCKQYKIEFVENIRKHKDIVKTYKFDTITSIESNLVNDNNLNIKTFLTLCAIENINIIFLNKKTYCELLMNDTNKIYVIHELDAQSKYYKKYGFEESTIDDLNTIKNTLYRIDNIAKPIKSISSYKVQDLLDICDKLSIETTNKNTGKKYSKNDMYEKIIQYF
jgi:hypothetical protein